MLSPLAAKQALSSHCIVSVDLTLSYLIVATNTPEPADVRIMVAANSTTNGSKNESNLHSGQDETVRRI